MNRPHIESYRFGRVVIDGESHEQDVIVLPDGVLRGWWRKEGHVLHPDDLKPVFEAAPEVLIVGLGAHGSMRVTSKTRKALEAADIELTTLTTAEACKLYNRAREERVTAAALHLTC